MTTTELEEQLQAEAKVAEAAVLQGNAKVAVKPVVFGGKVYSIPAEKSATEVFSNASASSQRSRQLKLKWDRSAVVLQPRTMALVNATGCM